MGASSEEYLRGGMIMASTVKEDSATAVVSKDSDELTEVTRLSRRSWLGTAGRAAALGAAGVLASAPALADGDDDDDDDDDDDHRRRRRCMSQAPRAIPGTDPFLASLGLTEKVFLPVPMQEPSTIFDFRGRIAIMDLIGDGIRTVDGVEESAAFRADLRIIEGNYVGLDGKRHRNTFHFI